MEAAKAKADELEAQLEELKREEEEAKAEADEAERKAAEAERLYTERSAAMLAEYAAKHEDKTRLEAELSTVRAELGAKRAANLELSRRNLALDRQDRQLREAVADAEELLAKCTSSQGDLNETLRVEEASCERAREAAGELARRLTADLQRLAAMRLRLSEVAEGGSDETRRLLAEAEAVLGQTREAQRKCEMLHQQCGKAPDAASEEQATEAPPAGQPYASAGA